MPDISDVTLSIGRVGIKSVAVTGHIGREHGFVMDLNPPNSGTLLATEWINAGSFVPAQLSLLTCESPFVGLGFRIRQVGCRCDLGGRE